MRHFLASDERKLKDHETRIVELEKRGGEVMYLDGDWANKVEKLEAEVEMLRTALGDALDAIDFARSEGFEWPTDPYTPAILKACPPIKLPAGEQAENTPGTDGQPKEA